ncbi:MAG: tryptophan-rich sensory protein, partial [Clostridia bacterium]|nr:tryptophan-rich sensory protein [Clostridia bacterium]
MKNKNILLLLCILIPLAVGGIAALLTREGMMTYQMMRQPVLAPPAWLFPVVWTILYILMGISSYLIMIAEVGMKEKE